MCESVRDLNFHGPISSTTVTTTPIAATGSAHHHQRNDALPAARCSASTRRTASLARALEARPPDARQKEESFSCTSSGTKWTWRESACAICGASCGAAQSAARSRDVSDGSDARCARALIVPCHGAPASAAQYARSAGGGCERWAV